MNIDDIGFYFTTVQFLMDCRKLGINDEQAWQLQLLISRKVREEVRESNRDAARDENLRKGE